MMAIVSENTDDNAENPREIDSEAMFEFIKSAYLALENRDCGVLTKPDWDSGEMEIGFACCQTCGHAELSDEVDEEKKNNPIGPAYVGYVFYHAQTADGVRENGECHFYFSDLISAQILVETLNEGIANGAPYEVEWNGKSTNAVTLKQV